jgi:hypothetical protein
LDDIDKELAKSAESSTPSKKRHLIYARERALNQLHPKSKSMYSLIDYREPVLDILKFPGLRRSFKAQSMEIFLRGRTIEVNLKSCVHAAS